MHVVDDSAANTAAWGSQFYVVGEAARRDLLIDEAAAKLSNRRTRAEAAGLMARSEVRTGNAADVIAAVADTRASISS